MTEYLAFGVRFVRLHLELLPVFIYSTQWMIQHTSHAKEDKLLSIAGKAEKGPEI